MLTDWLKEAFPQQYQFAALAVNELISEERLVRKIDIAMGLEFIFDVFAIQGGFLSFIAVSAFLRTVSVIVPPKIKTQA